MNKLILLLSFLFTFSLVAQDFPVDLTTNKITYTDVVKVDSLTKKEVLYQRAKMLCNTKENIIKVNDAEMTFSFKTPLTLKYPSNITGMSHTGVVEYVTTIMCKDGRYKYIITDFVHHSVKGDGGNLENDLPKDGVHIITKAGWASIKKQVREQLPKTVEQLKTNMKPTAIAPAKEDW